MVEEAELEKESCFLENKENFWKLGQLGFLKGKDFSTQCFFFCFFKSSVFLKVVLLVLKPH